MPNARVGLPRGFAAVLRFQRVAARHKLHRFARWRLRQGGVNSWHKMGDSGGSAMRVGVFFVVFAIIAGTLDFAVAQNERGAAASQVLALEKKWNDVYKRGDIAGMDSLLADDYIITSEHDSAFGKAGYIARSGDTSVHVDVSEM